MYCLDDLGYVYLYELVFLSSFPVQTSICVYILPMDENLSTKNPMPIQTTVLLLNNFIGQTSSFLNQFALTCERKLSTVSSRISNMETTLSIIETKLQSIDAIEMEEVEDLPDVDSEKEAQSPPSSSSEEHKTEEKKGGEEETMGTSLVVSDGDGSLPAGCVKAKDHPTYKRFACLDLVAYKDRFYACQRRSWLY